MSNFTTYLVTAPTTELLTMAEAKRHLNLDGSEAEPNPYTAPAVALATGTPGNVDNGAHRYAVSWVTADGETLCGPSSAAATITDKTTTGKVNLTDIQTGGSSVTARKVYRTKAGGADYFLLATIADNSTTSYTDNTADASLGVGEPTENTTGDALVAALIPMVRQLVERHTNMALLTQTVDFKADSFCLNRYGALVMPRRPLQSITSITYVDLEGATQTLDQSIYEVSLGNAIQPGRIGTTFGNVLPNTLGGVDKVTIRAVLGFTSAALVPAELKQAAKLALGHFYANREATVVGVMATDLPMGYQALITPYKALTY